MDSINTWLWIHLELAPFFAPTRPQASKSFWCDLLLGPNDFWSIATLSQKISTTSKSLTPEPVTCIFCDHDRVLRAFSIQLYSGFNLYRSKILEGLIPTTSSPPRWCWQVSRPPPPPKLYSRPCFQLERQIASIDLSSFILTGLFICTALHFLLSSQSHFPWSPLLFI